MMSAARSLSKKERRSVGVFIVAISLFALFSPLDDDNNSSFPGRRFLFSVHDDDTKPRKRLALIRPFGTRDGQALLDSFNMWDTRWPCVADDDDYDVELVLSYSRRLDDETEEGKLAAGIVDEIKNKFLGGNGWSQCFTGLRLIEADLDPSRDKYERHPITGLPDSMDWVSGPNGQFRSAMSEVMSVSTEKEEKDADADPVDENEPYYELAMIMEADNQPQRAGWLNELLQDAQAKAPFTVLGSKYKGRAWDGLEDAMPASLLHHINGNAIYNLTHPLFKHVLHELNSEAGTEFEAVPYDYRMSQIFHEGAYGTEPEFPFPWMTHQDGSAVKLSPKTTKFARWWANYGGKSDDNPVKESGLMSNFGQSNYLKEHIGDAPAIVHGLDVYQHWNPHSHKISLVVSALGDRSQHQDLLSELEQNAHGHPFQEVIIMENSHTDIDAHLPMTSVPVRVRERLAADVSDVCDAPVSTEWFYHTNIDHRVANNIDLLFTHDHPVSRPVVPFTPAESIHCTQYSACRETLRLARDIYPEMDKVVLNMDLPYHTPSRDAFCRYWRQMYGQNGEVLLAQEGGRKMARSSGVPLAPTATSYVAYLYRTGMADNLYHFTNVLVHGSAQSFIRVHQDASVDAEDEEEETSVAGNFERKLSKGKDQYPVKIDLMRKSRVLKNGNQPSCQPENDTCNDRKKLCCTGLVCGAGGTCETVPAPTPPPTTAPAPPPTPYGGGSGRKLSISDPGLLVEG